MADFGYFSDTDDSAVDELISQTKDLCVLEQVSAINCSGFTDSVLPTELEQRFHKLKSFPSTKTKTSSIHSPKHNPDSNLTTDPKPVPESQPASNPKQNPNETELVDVPELKLNSKPRSSPLSSSSSRKDLGSGSGSDPASDSDSPQPRRSGCLWCSPKSSSKKQNKRDRVRSLTRTFDWKSKSTSDELFSDLSVFSTKEQEKIMKEVMKEEEKVNREAEKIVKWAKQASMKIKVRDSEDELSDD